MARSTIKGIASYRRFLRRLPDSATGQLGSLLTFAAPDLAGYMRTLFPTRAGRLAASIGYKGPTKALNLKIGQVNKKAASDAFYGHILDRGFASGSKLVQRRHAGDAGKKRRGLSSFATSYTLHWKGRAGIHAVKKTADYFRSRFLPDYRDLTNKILADASRGAGDD